jgi:hypothetical protein
MMKWFSTHPNPFVIVITTFINILSWFVVLLFLYITKIPAWGPVYPPGTLDVLLPAFTSFAFDAYLLLADILFLFAFYWVLSKKNQNKLYLLFFVAFLPVDIPVFISYIISIDLPGILYLLRYVTILLWLTGWIILLVLKNKPTNTNNNNT